MIPEGERSNEVTLMNTSGNSQISPSNHGLPTVQSGPIFDSLFYKRLQHIERVLDEDPLELERFKNYFSSLQAVVSGKPQSNAFLLTNQKDLSLERLNEHKGKPNVQRRDELNAESSAHMTSQRKGATTNLEQYQDGESNLGGSLKKVVYSIK